MELFDPHSRASHPEHPPTAAYVARCHGGLDLDGFEGAFSSPRPSLEAAAGQALVAGLWVAPGEAELSWRSMVEREPRLDLSGFELESQSERESGCDWKIFMEIYFDDYHVEPFHPGLSSMADCAALEWLWEPAAQAQRVGSCAMEGSGSKAHARLFELSREIFGESPVAAVWAAVYPGTMVEWLGGAVAISTVKPKGPGASWNRVAFAYPKGVAASRPDFVLAHQEAYWETAREDDEIARRIQGGRDALARRGADESGPACPHLEAGVEHFHRWLARRPWEEPEGRRGAGASENNSTNQGVDDGRCEG